MTTPSTDPRYDALAELVLGTLPDEERTALEAWLAQEPAAQAHVRALREAMGALALTAPQVEPPATLRAKVLAIAGPTSASAATASSPAPTPVHGVSRPAGASLDRRSGWGWLAAAAALLLALGLGAYALQLRAEVARLEASLTDASARLVAAEADARGSRARLVRAQAETSILSAPDLRRVDLTGQKGAPAAVARAFWSRAQGLVLTATRLPDLPRGRTYQLWVLTTGAPVSAGVFTPDASGGASAVFDTPVSLPSPTGLAVSIEPEGGVPAPTGDIVLVGKAE